MQYQFKTIKTMNNFYYVIEKHLEEVGGFEETNGLKTIRVYRIFNGTIQLILTLELDLGENSILSIEDELVENEFAKEKEKINLTQL